MTKMKRFKRVLNERHGALTGGGTADAAKAVMSGKVIVCVECSPKFGPKAFELIKKLANGEKIPTNVGNIDRVFTKDNPKWVRDKYGELAMTAKDYLPEAF